MNDVRPLDRITSATTKRIDLHLTQDGQGLRSRGGHVWPPGLEGPDTFKDTLDVAGPSGPGLKAPLSFHRAVWVNQAESSDAAWGCDRARSAAVTLCSSPLSRGCECAIRSSGREQGRESIADSDTGLWRRRKGWGARKGTDKLLRALESLA
jgi:hypothetical protein